MRISGLSFRDPIRVAAPRPPTKLALPPVVVPPVGPAGRAIAAPLPPIRTVGARKAAAVARRPSRAVTPIGSIRPTITALAPVVEAAPVSEAPTLVVTRTITPGALRPTLLRSPPLLSQLLHRAGTVAIDEAVAIRALGLLVARWTGCASVLLGPGVLSGRRRASCRWQTRCAASCAARDRRDALAGRAPIRHRRLVSWAARHVQPRCRHRKQDQNNCRESNSRQPRTLVKFHHDTPKRHETCRKCVVATYISVKFFF